MSMLSKLFGWDKNPKLLKKINGSLYILYITAGGHSYLQGIVRDACRKYGLSDQLASDIVAEVTRQVERNR